MLDATKSSERFGLNQFVMAGGLAITFSPDHVHFFARPEIGALLMAKWVQLWKGVSSRKMAKALRILPPIWQADYFDGYLRSAESYSQKWNYVEQNPVRAGLVRHFEDWPYRGAIHHLMF